MNARYPAPAREAGLASGISPGFIAERRDCARIAQARALGEAAAIIARLAARSLRRPWAGASSRSRYQKTKAA